MSNCSGDCSSCKDSTCSEPQSFIEKPHELSKVKRIFGVVSGKGGVGKSLVAGLLASEINKQGFKTAVLDADITGPSIPRMFGVSGVVEGDDTGIYPKQSKLGVSIISANLLLENETDPIVWRGPMIAGVVKQFWTNVIWNDIDYMFVDMPPGTGDVSLTVFQSLPLDGIVIVTSPQELVSMIVKKAIKMAEMMEIPVVGVVENMSYITCTKCGEQIRLFGSEEDKDIALLDKIPIDHKLAKACDAGKIEDINVRYIDNTIEEILSKWPVEVE